MGDYFSCKEKQILSRMHFGSFLFMNMEIGTNIQLLKYIETHNQSIG